jgi:hypothetical protein
MLARRCILMSAKLVEPPAEGLADRLLWGEADLASQNVEILEGQFHMPCPGLVGHADERPHERSVFEHGADGRF